jgi:SagB-type dehydrogenase family enzyme
MIPFEDPTALSLLYHLNSEPWSSTKARQKSAGEVEYRKFGPPSSALVLPPSAESPLKKLIRDRCSSRRYRTRPMPVQTLSTLLFAAYGLTREMPLADQTSYICRSVPSAGGVYPLEIYPLLQGVEGVADGLHHYNVFSNALEPVRIGMVFAELRSIVMTFPFIESANIVCFLVAVFARSQRKYGPRGYRYILLEAGHSAQNICLAATQNQLGSLCVGGFFDGTLNRILRLDPLQEAVVYAVAAGYAS